MVSGSIFKPQHGEKGITVNFTIKKYVVKIWTNNKNDNLEKAVVKSFT